MMNQEHKRPVTLEDLLRLKRAERPPAEFWTRFDHDLRAKQLAAIVEKRPWWRTLPTVFGSLSRYHVPLGATAILALTVLTVREYRSSALESGAPSPANVGAADSPAVSSGAEIEVARSAVLARETSAVAARDSEPAPETANLALASEATAPGQLSQIAALLGASNATVEATPSARFIAANLALAKGTEPAIAQNLLGGARGFEARAMPARAPVVDPLAQMASPSDVRRSRLLNGAAMAVSMKTAVPTRNSEFRSRRLSDEQLYDTISRIGASADSVNFKF